MTQNTYDGQTAKMIATLAQNMPDLDREQMQYWIGKPAYLSRALEWLFSADPKALEEVMRMRIGTCIERSTRVLNEPAQGFDMVNTDTIEIDSKTIKCVGPNPLELGNLDVSLGFGIEYEEASPHRILHLRPWLDLNNQPDGLTFQLPASHCWQGHTKAPFSVDRRLVLSVMEQGGWYQAGDRMTWSDLLWQFEIDYIDNAIEHIKSMGEVHVSINDHGTMHWYFEIRFLKDGAAFFSTQATLNKTYFAGKAKEDAGFEFKNTDLFQAAA